MCCTSSTTACSVLPPCCCCACAPGKSRRLREPLAIAFLVFSAWALTSLLWSPEHHADTDLFKRPLHTFMLFAGCGLLLHYRNELFKPIFFSAAVIALVVCVCNLVAFSKGFEPGTGMRMIGGRGALDNPLLSSHVFGFSASTGCTSA